MKMMMIIMIFFGTSETLIGYSNLILMPVNWFYLQRGKKGKCELLNHRMGVQILFLGRVCEDHESELGEDRWDVLKRWTVQSPFLPIQHAGFIAAYNSVCTFLFGSHGTFSMWEKDDTCLHWCSWEVLGYQSIHLLLMSDMKTCELTSIRQACYHDPTSSSGSHQKSSLDNR